MDVDFPQNFVTAEHFNFLVLKLNTKGKKTQFCKLKYGVVIREHNLSESNQRLLKCTSRVEPSRPTVRWLFLNMKINGFVRFDRKTIVKKWSLLYGINFLTPACLFAVFISWLVPFGTRTVIVTYFVMTNPNTTPVRNFFALVNISMEKENNIRICRLKQRVDSQISALVNKFYCTP